jgi:hypothetical protein
MSARHLLGLAGSLLLAGVAEPAAPHIGVAARVYNTARVPSDLAAASRAVAAQTLGAARIGVAWRNCDDIGECSHVPSRGELVVRLVRSGDPTGTPAALVLGEASIDTAAGAGVLATIYVDRVALMAELSETDTVSLLGRAIAHEVGHLLLATNAHSSRGLMRAQWTPQEIRRNQATDWILTKQDAVAIRRRFERRAGSAFARQLFRRDLAYND